MDTSTRNDISTSDMENSSQDPGGNVKDETGENQSKNSKPEQEGSTLDKACAVVPSGTSSSESLKSRVLWTCTVFYTHACMALMIGSLGPAFLDLVDLVDATVETGSFIFTAQAIGGVVGGLSSAVFYTRFQAELVLTVNVCCTAALTIAFPFCPTLWLMCVVIALRGVSIYMCLTGCALVSLGAWREHEGSPVLQALHCAFSAGGVVAPFIMSGFLQEQGCVGDSVANHTLQMGNITVTNHTSQIESITVANHTSQLENGTLTGEESEGEGGLCGESQVFWGFVIIGLITVANVVCCLILLARASPVASSGGKEQQSAEGTKSVEEKDESSFGAGMKFAFLTVIVVYFMMIVAFETLMQNYLATFVTRHLGWTKTSASTATSVFWATFACGRFLAIFTAKILTPWRMMVLNFGLLSVAIIVLVLAIEIHDAVLWVCVSGSGLFLSPLYAAGCSFIDENILTITGKIYSVFLVSETTGSIIYPIILGTLIDNFSPLWFLYLAVILSVTCDVDFIILTLMEKRWGKKSRNRKLAAIEMTVGDPQTR